MLELSDASGRGAGTPFDPYLTGYVLPQSGRYALARTWFAPEMPRPGCVWTHTLILGEAMLAELDDPSRLVALFQRPDGLHTDLSAYGRPLRNERPTPWRTGGPGFSTEAIAALIEAAYDAWPSALLIRAESATEFEALVFAMWQQQWPGLRKAMTFCSGAFSVRTTGDGPLWLQAGPESALRRHSPTPVFDLYAARRTAAGWALAAAHDIEITALTPLRTFLARAGGKSADAHLFSSLVTLYGLLPSARSGPKEWKLAADSAARMAEEDPRLPHNALEAVLGPRENAIEEAAILEALIERRDARFNVPERVGKLWASDDTEALRLTSALADFDAHLAKNAIEAAAPHLSPKRLDEMARDENSAVSRVLALVATRYAGLFLHERFSWPFNEATMAVAKAVAAQLHEVQANEGSLFTRLIESGDDRWAPFAFSLVDDEPSLVHAILEAAAAGVQVETSWWHEVALRSPAANQWLARTAAPSPTVLVGIATAALRLNSKVAAAFDAGPWAALAHLDRDRFFRRGNEGRVLCLLGLGVAARHVNDPLSVILVDTSVAVLFDEARSGRLTPEERDWMSSVLPHDGKGRDWDLCERMVKLLVNVAQRHQPDPRTLLGVAHPLIRSSMERRVQADQGGKGPWWSSFIPWWR